MKTILSFCKKQVNPYNFFHFNLIICRLLTASNIRKICCVFFFPAVMNALNAAIFRILFASEVVEKLFEEFGSEHIDL